MTREEAMLKLLALGPMQFPELAAITGWGDRETNAVVRRLLAKQRVGQHHPGGGSGPLLFFLPNQAPRRAHTRGRSGYAFAISDQPRGEANV